MGRRIFLAAIMALLSNIALADDGVILGAGKGRIASAAVGGAVGEMGGGISSDRQAQFRRYVLTTRRPSYPWRNPVAIGSELPADVLYWEVPPGYGVRDYRYAVINDETVLLDPRSRRIVQIVDADNQRLQGAWDPDGDIR